MPLTRAGLILGVANVMANALGYAFTLVLAGALVPAQFGALGALFGVALISAIPGNALQLVVGRATARAAPDELAAATRAGLRLATLAGAALLLVTVAISPLLVAFLHLDAVAPVLWLGATLLPYTVTTALQGVLLGRQRFARLGIVNVLTAAARLSAGVVAALAGWSLTGVLAAIAVAAALSLMLVWALVRPGSVGSPSNAGRRPMPVRETLLATVGVAGLIVLSNSDVLLARHFLSADESGVYVLAALFAKAGLWGTQFVAMLFFPRMSSVGQRSRAVARSAAVVGGLGVLLVIATAALAGPLVRSLPGEGYRGAVDVAWAFAVLGTLWALVQLMVLAAVAENDGTIWRVLGFGILAQTVLIVTVAHDSVTAVLGACAATAAAIVATAGLRELTRPDPILPSRELVR